MTVIEEVIRAERGRLLSTLIRSCGGDFEIAEDALQEAVVIALETWGNDPPERPSGWLLTTARRRALDVLRRDRNWEKKSVEFAELTKTIEEPVGVDGEWDEIPDERLRLIFTCCHPAIAPEAQVALTLQTIGGLTAREIGRAFLVPESTMAQRLVRAKRKIRRARIPYQIPPPHRLKERLDSVLAVVYLIFNEGYAAGESDELVRIDLCSEAIHLGRVLAALLPEESEVLGLLALMLFNDSRRATRVDDNGGLVVLEEQDRSNWDQNEIREANEILEIAVGLPNNGPYVVQAAIAALHALAESFDKTDWPQIAALYRGLYWMQPTPVVALNRAVAEAMARGPEAGLYLLEKLAGDEALERHHLYHSSKADLLRRAGRFDEAIPVYEEAISLCENAVQRHFLERRLKEARERVPHPFHSDSD